jgi:hypothetical protein
LNQRIARALGGLCAAGLAVVLATACSSKHTPSGQGDHSPGADLTGSANAGESASADPTAPGGFPATGKPGGAGTTRACAAGDLTLAQLPDGDAAGGNVVVAISLTNKSSRACSVNGYPDFTLAGTSGSQPITIEHNGFGMPAFSAPPAPVTLSPAGKAGFLVAYLNRPKSGDGSCGAASRMSLTIGGAMLTGPVQISVCGEPFKVSPYVSPSNLTVS